MATEKINLYGRIYPIHQSPYLTASIEFEHPSIQDNRLRFRPVDLKVSGLSMSGRTLMPTKDIEFDPQPQILSLSARAQLSEGQVQPLGMMTLNPFCLSNDGQYYWDWHLTNSDIERIIEKNRHDSDLQIHLRFDGILGVQITGTGLVLFNIQGANHFKLSRSTWNTFLQVSGHTGEFIEVLPTTVIKSGDPSWNAAVKRLAGARRQLTVGYTYLALEECLSILEKVTPEPYNSKQWLNFLSELNIAPDSKREAIANLFAGVGTYLNKVGHHHSRTEKNENTQEHVRPPLDAYEAEILLAATHLVLTYIGKIQAEKHQ